MQPEDMVTVIRRQLAYINAHDMAGVAAMYAPNLVVEDFGTGTRFEGRDAFLAYFEQLIGAFSDLRSDVVSITAQENRAAVEFVAEGTHDGPLGTPTGTIPPSGRHVVVRWATVFEFDENGEAATIRRYTDPLGLLAQLGVMDAPAPSS